MESTDGTTSRRNALAFLLMKTDFQPSEKENNETGFTEVEILYREGRLNYRLLFGHPVKVVEKEFIYGRITRKQAFFRPGDIFALDLWERNSYGTTGWAVYVLQAIAPGELDAVKIPQVKPAVKVLLEAHGKSRARRALEYLREIQNRTDPATLPPARFLLTDFRLKASMPTRARAHGI